MAEATEAVLPAPSGRLYVVASRAYPCSFPDCLCKDLVAAVPGDLIELTGCHADWGLGLPLVRCGSSSGSGSSSGAAARAAAMGGIPDSTASAVGFVPGQRRAEGAFRLEWVLLVTVCIETGRPMRVDVEAATRGGKATAGALLSSPQRDNGGCGPRAVAARFREAKQRQWLQHVDKIWRLYGELTANSSASSSSGAAAPWQFEAEKQAVAARAAQDAADMVAVLRGGELNKRGSGQLADSTILDLQLPSSKLSPAAGLVMATNEDQRRLSKVAIQLLNAKRSGELHALAEEWQRAQTAIASSASGLATLPERFKLALLGAHRTGELRRVTGEFAREFERKADEFQQYHEDLEQLMFRQVSIGGDEDQGPPAGDHAPPTKERVLRSLLEMKRSGELERLAQDMGETQAQLERKALQLREIAARMARGLRAARRSGELERIAAEMTHEPDAGLDDNIHGRAFTALIRAYRAGELQMLRGELDELADVVPTTLEPAPTSGKPAGASSSSCLLLPEHTQRCRVHGGPATTTVRKGSIEKRRRWAEMTSSDSSDLDMLQQHTVSSRRSGTQLGVSVNSNVKGGLQCSHPSTGSMSDSFSEGENAMSADFLEQTDGKLLPESSPKKSVPVRRRFARSLLNAMRSGELQALAEDWQRTRTAIASSASSLQKLTERFKLVILGAHRTGELHRLAAELASDVEQQADELQRLKQGTLQSLESIRGRQELEQLEQVIVSKDSSSARLSAKERALQSLLQMKRSGGLEGLAKEMGDAQAKLEAKAVQLREIANREQHPGLGGDASRSDDLAIIAGEMEQELATRLQRIRRRLRQGLLRAHRTGELHELRGELDELVDTVSALEPGGAANEEPVVSGNVSRVAVAPATNGQPRRWADMTSSESDHDPRVASRGRGCVGRPPPFGGASHIPSDSDSA